MFNMWFARARLRHAGTVNGELMAAEMAAQPGVLARLAARAPEDVALVRAAVPSPLAGVVFAARGSSDNAAMFGRYLAELAGRRPAGLAAPSLYTRYRAQVDWRGYLVVALSQSGATPEIVTTCRAMRSAGAVVLGITNEPGSPLSDTADVVLATQAGPERAIPATKTVTSQFAVLLSVAAALAPGPRGASTAGTAPAAGTALTAGTGPTAETASTARGVPTHGSALAGLAAGVGEVLGDLAPVTALARRWAAVDRLVVAGRGLAYAAALETALKVKETTGILAEGFSTADLRHGPIATVYAGAPVLLIDAGGPAAADLADLRGLLARSGATAATLPLPPGPEAASVIAAVVRGQQLAYALARARGADPDAPANLTKVTATT
jgi:glucosamine--fructose-6-phosphate aminotransferase (isomerizing)